MDKFIIWNYQSEPENTRFEYEVGEIITVNSSEQYRCMEKKIVDGNLYHYFKQGRRIYDFSY